LQISYIILRLDPVSCAFFLFLHWVRGRILDAPIGKDWEVSRVWLFVVKVIPAVHGVLPVSLEYLLLGLDGLWVGPLSRSSGSYFLDWPANEVKKKWYRIRMKKEE
jgi:hypothetical protein